MILDPNPTPTLNPYPNLPLTLEPIPIPAPPLPQVFRKCVPMLGSGSPTFTLAQALALTLALVAVVLLLVDRRLFATLLWRIKGAAAGDVFGAAGDAAANTTSVGSKRKWTAALAVGLVTAGASRALAWVRTACFKRPKQVATWTGVEWMALPEYLANSKRGLFAGGVGKDHRIRDKYRKRNERAAAAAATLVGLAEPTTAIVAQIEVQGAYEGALTDQAPDTHELQLRDTITIGPSGTAVGVGAALQLQKNDMAAAIARAQPREHQLAALVRSNVDRITHDEIKAETTRCLGYRIALLSSIPNPAHARRGGASHRAGLVRCWSYGRVVAIAPRVDTTDAALYAIVFDSRRFVFADCGELGPLHSVPPEMEHVELLEKPYHIAWDQMPGEGLTAAALHRPSPKSLLWDTANRLNTTTYRGHRW